ncbi:hypothetical protein BN2497_3793 [Janthinobacterium sp. CG23_2]|nr:hypothetical protein BN2497_3793 [Janthinobacterium sp. CG23_2]CUU28294.1 hypothetical protein BN3177_3793 [Janthinobacterium sp. CG23_2]
MFGHESRPLRHADIGQALSTIHAWGRNSSSETFPLEYREHSHD